MVTIISALGVIRWENRGRRMTREELAKVIREDFERKGVWACKVDTINMRLDFEMLGIILEALEQEPKTGHWVKIHPLQADDGGAYMCSCCGTGDWRIKGTENFCHNCGAKMVEPQESEK